MTKPFISDGRTHQYDEECHACYLKGAFEANPLFKDSLESAKSALKHAVDNNKDYARAHGELGYTYVNMATSGWFSDQDEDKLWREAFHHAERAVELAPYDYINHWNLAHCLVNTGKEADFAAGLERFEKALDLFNTRTDPMDRKPGLLAEYGEVLVYGGEVERGIELIEKATRTPDWYFWNLAFARYCAMDYDGAIEALDRMRAKPGDERFLFASLFVRGAAEAQRGNQAEAEQAVRQFHDTCPDPEQARHLIEQEWRENGFRGFAEKDSQSPRVKTLVAHWNEGLEKAGFRTGQ